MKSIGGYFELEQTNGTTQYHETPYLLKSGRAALHCILKATRPALVYLPYYTCDAVLDPFKASGTGYRFYGLDRDLEPQELPVLKQGEYLLYIDYFGIKGDFSRALNEKYGDKLIIDATQAFFSKGNGRSWLFNSCRKFFGVPDGGYLYIPEAARVELPDERNKEYITDHLYLRREKSAAEGYPFFVRNEELMNSDILAASSLTSDIMRGVDYQQVISQRRQNYNYLHEALNGRNMLKPHPGSADVPMCYPLLLSSYVNRSRLYSQQVFPPVFWKEVLTRLPEGFEMERSLAERLLPLPVDHRYTTSDMAFVVSLLEQIISRA